ncbi:MAG: TetM/TetW/TetO/TetS family tetracycline resistance ribosomal protection protein [[Clostridium] cellulosi]
MKKLVIGILAHVDAGKTTLSEGMLYLSGKIRKLGRVDNKDSYLDTYELERQRGITIFSKQAIFEVDDTQITLLDTPGHVDFSAETERTLQVLDYAVLVVSGADGVQGHTKTLWRLLEMYNIPVFIFINKMDQNGTDKDKLLREIKERMSNRCVEFEQINTTAFFEEIAMCDEELMDTYLETGHIDTALIKKAIKKRKIYPCLFGSALKLEGVERLLHTVVEYTDEPSYPAEFGAKIFKISRDSQGNRLTHLKVTGGKLKVKDILSGDSWKEKVDQIRIYSGEKFKTVNEIEAGGVCAVTGLSNSRPGEGLGIEKASNKPVLEPVLSYRIILPDGMDPRAMLPKLRQIEEEEPELHIVWDERLQEIKVQVMGEVQTEILQSVIKNRFGVDVAFGEGKIVYKETIANAVEGVGHFEPLRHYAEVHLLLEPGEPGSGLQFDTICSEDLLSRNWQRLILTHLKEKEHKGVLTGSAITDMKITLVSGKASNKHTEGGDFREATYRAVRQGLKEAESILLEPVYAFQLELPKKMVGRAMSDIENMHGTYKISQTDGETVVLTGTAPVITMRNYQKEVAAYTGGLGRLFCSLKGYEPCHNAEEVIESIGYDSERDMENPTGSVFCAHGAGFLVDWYEVKNYMHLPSYFQDKTESEDEVVKHRTQKEEMNISPEEVDEILKRTSYANQRDKEKIKQKPKRESYSGPINRVSIKKENKEEYLLVDGYNIIHAWPELKDLADENMDGARMKLIETLSNYQGYRKCQIIVVFDAYRVERHVEEAIDFNNIHIIYTREAQTADQYIERFSHNNKKKYSITVATSDALEQLIVRGAGCSLLSANELKAEIEKTDRRIRQEYRQINDENRNYLKDTLPSKTKREMEEMINKGRGVK